MRADRATQDLRRLPCSARKHDANGAPEVFPIRARRLAPTAPTVSAAPTAPTVRASQGGWLRGHPSIGSGEWPVRPRVATTKVITPRSSALLKRPTLGVVLGSPFVAADYAQQISHGSPSSTSVWIGADVTGSGSLGMAVPRLLVCWRVCLRLACPVSVTLRHEYSRPSPLRSAPR